MSNPTPRLSILAFALVIVSVIVGAVLVFTSRPQPAHVVIQPPIPTPTITAPAEIEVYVTGAVNQPNSLITLPYGSRVSDALTRVGGTSPAADLARVNLAAILRDGDQVHVYSVQEAVVSEAVATPQGGAVIFINTASLDELQTLSGIGEVLAQRIVDHREQVGRFNSMADLDTIEGIGASLMERLQGRISFE